MRAVLLLLLVSVAREGVALPQQVHLDLPHDTNVGAKLFRNAPWLHDVRLKQTVDGQHEFFQLVRDRGDHHLQLNGFLHKFAGRVLSLQLLHPDTGALLRLLRLRVLPETKPPTATATPESPVLKYVADEPLSRTKRQATAAPKVIEVLESASSGSLLFVAVSPTSSSERYVFKAPPPPELTIDASTGQVFLKLGSNLDYDDASRRQIDFTVLVETSDGRGLLRSLDYRLVVRQVADEKPEILRFAKQIWAVLYRQTSTLDGATVFRLQARVPDNSSAILSYELIPGMTNRTEGRYRVVPDLGYIVTKLNDGYPPNKVYELGVRAINVGSSNPRTKYGYAFVRVFTTYQPPQFSEEFYRFNLLESAASGSAVGQVACRSINNVWSTTTLTSRMSTHVSSYFGMDSNGTIRTLRSLDFDVSTNPRLWYFTAVCTENATSPSPRSSEAEVAITLIDVDDNRPYFSLQNYARVTPVPENVATNTEVYRLRAIDTDTKPNANLTYILSGANSSFFNVSTDPVTLEAVIRVASANGIDYESLPVENKQAVFIISVTDGVSGSSLRPSATVMIPIQNVNDNPPSLGNFTVQVQRKYPAGTTVLQLQAQDIDGSSINYHFWTGTATSQQFPSLANVQLTVNQNSGIVTVGAAGLTSISTATYVVPIRAVDDGTCEGCPIGAALRSEISYMTLTVLDTDEAAPVFTNCPTTSVTFEEEQPAGTELIRISATDSTSGSSTGIQYNLLDNLIITNPNKFFRINSTTGIVFAATVLDIESSTDKINMLKNYFWLTVQAKNIFNDRFTLCNFQVRFQDVNDNVPTFDLDERLGSSTPRLDVVVSTTTGGGTIIGNAQAFDLDVFGTPFSTIEYTLRSTAPSAYSTNFDVTFANNLCNVRARTGLGAIPNMTLITLTIEARNPASAPLTPVQPWNQLQFVILVTSAPDLLPPPVVTVPSAYSITILENTTLFSTVFSLSTTETAGKILIEDRYGKFTQTNLGSDSHFGLRTSSSSVCSGSSCNMVIKKALAYEDFRVFAISSRVTSYTKSTGTSIDRIYTDVYKQILLTDVNNHKPRFINQDYIDRSFMLENAPTGTRVTQAFAVDKDNEPAFRTVRYSLDTTKADDHALFTINTNTGVISTAALPTSFDAESSKNIFYFEVVAEDSAQSSEPGIIGPNKHNLPISVRLTDANDNSPTFPSTVYYFTIREDATIGTIVGRVTGTDRDTSSVLRYQISSGDTNFDFYTDVTTGDIRVAKPLSYFRTRNYLITYTVSDGINSANTQVNITVIDINNNSPEFRPTAYFNITNVTEGQPAQAIWTLTGLDKDVSTPTYSVAGTWVSPPYNLFSVNPSSGVLSTNAPLDRELSPVFRFNALLADNQVPNLVGYAVVEVWPQDINDNRPVWKVSSLHGQLLDGSGVGTNFMNLIAIDPDTTGTLTYALVPGSTNGSRYVSVAPNGQVVTTATLGVADREALPSDAPRGIFSFLVTVTDGVGTPVTGTASVTIVDVNDNAPTFDRAIYYLNVPETTEVGENIFTAAATDIDSVDDGRLNYQLLDHMDYFAIQNIFEVNGGAVILRKNLDYENASMPKTFSVRIRVVDSTPPPFSASCTLSISVIESNDNSPVLTFAPGSSITRQEGPSSVGDTGYTFGASDADISDTAFTFAVLPSADPYGNLELTSVSATGGEIRVKAALDREIWSPAASADAVHEFVVTAADARGRTGSGTLTVTIQDLNDTPPNLRQEYTVTIMENEPIGTVAMTGSTSELFVEDKDKSAAGGPFTITADLSAGNNWTGLFTLTTVSGTSFRINSAKVFDRESDQKYYLLQVLMRDGGGNVGTGTVTVIIGDKDDNPMFSNGYKQAYVYLYAGNTDYWFNTSTRLGLGYAVVFDNDDWDRALKTYELTTATEYFSMNATGFISLKGGTPASNFSLLIKVTDSGGAIAYCQFVVTITVLPYDALLHSGSMVIDNIDSVSFVRRLRIPGTETLGVNRFPSFNFSVYDYVKLDLSRALNTTFEKTHIFYVDDMPDGSGVLVRYTALGSPYYFGSRLSSLVSLRSAALNRTLSDSNATLGMLPIDQCRLESEGPGGCTSGCKNTMIIRRRTPASVIRNSTALIGINVTLVSTCDCRASSYVVPSKCSEESCFHDGNCTDIPGSFTYKCACPAGYEGPRCQRLKVGFRTQGFLALSSIEGGCAYLHLSFYFITTQTAASVLLLYTGEFKFMASADIKMKDFMALELINGKPKLSIEVGSGVSVGGLHTSASASALNDGRWHRIDIFLRNRNIILKVDRCDNAPTILDGDPTAPNLASCMAEWVLAGAHYKLNVASFPLFIGGRYDMTNTALYPTGLATTGFLGQIARVRLNSMYYDLYAGSRSWYLNAENDFPSTTPSCTWSDGTPKCRNGWCWGVLGGATSSGTCSCSEGYRLDSNGRCTVPLVASELKANSYIGWKAKSALMSSLAKQRTRLDIQFKTRATTGTLLRVGGDDPYRPEHMQLAVQDSRLVYEHNLGDYAVVKIMLPNGNVSDGAWHWVRVSRNLRDVELMLDGDEGYNYGYLLGESNSTYNYLVLGDRATAGAQLSTETGRITIQPPNSDLTDTCVSTVRVDEKWFPLRSALGSEAAAAATVERIENVVEGCANGTPIACPVGVSCPSNLVCLPAWRPMAPPVCGCAAGYTLYGGTCYLGGACLLNNPCLPNGVCSVLAGVIRCTCNAGWQGDRCRIPIVALGGASLIIIILLLVLFLLFLAALLIWFCCCGAKKGDPLLIDAPYENVIEYNEEGGGQEDKLSFDMAHLRVKVSDSTVVKQSVTMLQSSRTDFSSMLQGRLAAANTGPDPSPFDGVLDYEYEGRGAVADDLDSIVSADDNAAQNFEFLKTWGPKFQRVTEIYTSFPDNADDLQSTADLDSVFEAGRGGRTVTTTVTTTRNM